MKQVILYDWDEPFASFHNLQKIVMTEDNVHIILMCPHEWELSDLNPTISEITSFKRILKFKNIKIDLIIGRSSEPVLDSGDLFFEDILYHLSDVITIHYWKNYLLCFYITKVLIERINHPLTERNFCYSFVSQNHYTHPHRALMMDELARNDLIDNNIVTWLCPGEYYKWKYWQERKINLDRDLVDPKTGDLKFEHCDPDGYYESFVQLVPESTNSCIFYTEKTTKPLYVRKPFLIVGASGINNGLKKFGFELYDEIFDYSFDDWVNANERYANISDQLKELDNNKKHFPELFKKIKPKLLHNFNVLIDLIMDDKHVPEIVLEIPVLRDKYYKIMNAHRQLLKKKGIV